jgi:hypothetical protein
MDRSPAAGSWLPDNAGIWTDDRDYRKTPVIGHITGCGFSVTGHHRYLDRSMDSPRRYFLPILGFRRAGQREKKPMHCKRKPKLLEKQNFIFLKIKCIAFTRISIHFFLPHMDFKMLFLLIK